MKTRHNSKSHKGNDAPHETVRILHLEDDPVDSELILTTLQSARIECTVTRVQTGEEFVDALNNGTFDVILADYKLPSYDGMSALLLTQKVRPTIPFIFVSGKLGEDAAIEGLTEGATDYVLKNKLSRLAPAVKRALSEAENRKKRALAEEALQESNERFEKAFQMSPMGISISRAADSKLIEVNNEFIRIFGYSREELIGHTALELQLFAQPEEGIKIMQNVQAHDEMEPFEFTARKKSGEMIIGLTALSVIYLHGEKHRLSLLLDITQRKRSEERIRYLTRLYALLSDVNQTLVRVKQKDVLFQNICNISIDAGKFSMAWIGVYESHSGQIVPVAHAGDEKGYSCYVDQMLDAQYIDAMNSSCRTRQVVVIQKESGLDENAAYHGINYHSYAAIPFGSKEKIEGVLNLFTAEDEFFKSEEIRLLEEIALDISFALETMNLEAKHEQAEEAVRQSEQKYRTLFEDSFDALVVTSANGKIIDMNKKGITLLGYGSKEEVVGLDLATDIYANPEIRQNIRETVNALGTGEFEIVVKTKSGKKIVSYCAITAVKDEQGNVSSYRVIARDITEHKFTESEIRKLSHVVEQSPVSVIITNVAGMIEYVNTEFVNQTGYTLEEVRGKSPNILKSDKTSEEEYRRLWETISSGKLWRGEFHNKKKNGQLIWNAASIGPLRNAENKITHYVGIEEDITERKLAEEHLKQTEAKRHQLELELIQSQKLESLGTLASGIAHDFNNILNIILGYSSLEKGHIAQPEKLSHDIDVMEKAAIRGTSLIKQLLTFARKTETLFVSVNINGLLSEIAKFMNETFPKSVAITTQFQSNIPELIADSTQLHQVFMNLFINARDAMPQGGTLSISTSVVNSGEIASQFPNAVLQDYILVSVTDTGTGIDEKLKQRIFDPFFTTKPQGKGTGLGLALVQSIIENHRGIIDLTSTIGKGTTFKIYLPAEQNISQAEKIVEETKKELQGGNETILLIEDEEPVIAMIQVMLETYGYTVLIARDGEEGVEKFKQNREKIDLVLTDLGLPKCEGDEVIRRITVVEPDTKIILVSGFIDPVIKTEMVKIGVRRFLQKPYTFADIIEMVRETIDEK